MLDEQSIFLYLWQISNTHASCPSRMSFHLKFFSRKHRCFIRPIYKVGTTVTCHTTEVIMSVGHLLTLLIKCSLLVINAIPIIFFFPRLWIGKFENATSLTIDGSSVSGFPKLIVLDGEKFALRLSFTLRKDDAGQ